MYTCASLFGICVFVLDAFFLLNSGISDLINGERPSKKKGAGAACAGRCKFFTILSLLINESRYRIFQKKKLMENDPSFKLVFV
jgi:hypothetical protein